MVLDACERVTAVTTHTPRVPAIPFLLHHRGRVSEGSEVQVGKFTTAEDFLEDHQMGLIEAQRSDTQSLSSKALCFRHLFERRVHQSRHVVVGERRKFSAQGRRCRRQGGRVIVGVVRKLGLYLFTCVYTGTYMSYCGV